MADVRDDLYLGMGPHESLHLIEHLIDVRRIGRHGGEAKECTLAEVLVIELRRRDVVAAAGRIEEVTQHLSFVLQTGRGGHKELNAEKGGWHSEMIPPSTAARFPD